LSIVRFRAGANT